jgi:hypothetical protein
MEIVRLMFAFSETVRDETFDLILLQDISAVCGMEDALSHLGTNSVARPRVGLDCRMMFQLRINSAGRPISRAGTPATVAPGDTS